MGSGQLKSRAAKRATRVPRPCAPVHVPNAAVLERCVLSAQQCARVQRQLLSHDSEPRAAGPTFFDANPCARTRALWSFGGFDVSPTAAHADTSCTSGRKCSLAVWRTKGADLAPPERRQIGPPGARAACLSAATRWPWNDRADGRATATPAPRPSAFRSPRPSRPVNPRVSSVPSPCAARQAAPRMGWAFDSSQARKAVPIGTPAAPSASAARCRVRRRSLRPRRSACAPRRRPAAPGRPSHQRRLRRPQERRPVSAGLGAGGDDGIDTGRIDRAHLVDGRRGADGADPVNDSMRTPAPARRR